MKKRVLVFPCGSEIGLEIFRALRFSKDFEVFGASSVDDHGKFVYENYIQNVPQVDDPKFIAAINRVVKENKIEFIFPAHDSVVLSLATHAQLINAKIITSPAETCRVARSKLATYEKLAATIDTPRVYDSPDEVTDFPAFLKPDVGQGSKGTLIAATKAEITSALMKDRSLLILEYLPGNEYTIDCFTDRNGHLLFSQARQRVRISNGISVNSKLVQDPQFRLIAEKINQALKFRGVWFFQAKQDGEGRLCLMEIAPRVAGTMALCRMQGANLTLLSLYDAMDMDVSLLINDFDVEIDRALAAKFRIGMEYDKVYVDFDDTIVLEDTTNYLIIGLLYKFIAEGKKIVLITKHLERVEDTLQKHRISRLVFSEVISLSKREKKSDHMVGSAIFIDDSFAERKEVFDKLGIPVFDIGEAIELL